MFSFNSQISPAISSAVSKSQSNPMTEYYRNYLSVGIFILAAIAMVGAMLGVARLLRPNVKSAQKYKVYESGSDPIGGLGQSNIRYYIFALLFVIFDVEAIFVFPWALNVEGLGVFGFNAMAIFLVVLFIGLAYDWRKGLLKWA
jgi:NADH-quinone oxidoreductase subunit A